MESPIGTALCTILLLTAMPVCFAQSAQVRCVRTGPEIEFVSPAFIYRVRTDGGLKAVSWENRLTGKKIPLGGADVEFDLDAARQRIFITGWKTIASHIGPSDPNQEPGYLKKFAALEFDDAAWTGRAVPPSFKTTESPLYSDYTWARTHVFLPREAASRELSLVLGGFGLFEFRYLRVFVNGREVGTRLVQKRWSEPGVFDLGPKSSAHQSLRFGNDNIIAVQACGYRSRTPHLEEAYRVGEEVLPLFKGRQASSLRAVG